MGLSKNLAINFKNEEQAVALLVFKKALQAPFSKMALNAGANPEVLMLTLSDATREEGINFVTLQKENLFAAGIIDPAKVTRCALKNAISVSGALLLTNHSIVEETSTT